jgi:hypothetical protein
MDNNNSTNWFAMATDTPRAHVCNCIGCCKVCGHCRTDPKHTPEACKKIAAAREIIKDALS